MNVPIHFPTGRPHAQRMLPALLVLPTAALLKFPSLTPPTPASVFKAAELALYAADRQRDELLSGVKRELLGEDPLDKLSPGQYALAPATSTVAVTGATDGIGREAALFLARAGYSVVICARDSAKGESVATEMRTEAFGARVSVVPLDLASVRSVDAAVPLIRAAATELGAPLRGLVCNAGVWPGQQQTSTHVPARTERRRKTYVGTHAERGFVGEDVLEARHYRFLLVR